MSNGAETRLFQKRKKKKKKEEEKRKPETFRHFGKYMITGPSIDESNL